MKTRGAPTAHHTTVWVGKGSNLPPRGYPHLPASCPRRVTRIGLPPGRSCAWRGDRKSWWIHGDYLHQAEQIAQRYFEPEVPMGIFRMDPYELLRLPPGASWKDAHAAHMALARECPGDVQRLRELELAFEATLAGY